MLILSVWALWEDVLGLNRGCTGALSLVTHIVLKKVWDTYYWDEVVTPAYKLASWNVRRVAFLDAPVALLTLAHFVTFGAPVVFVSFHIVAQISWALAIHFPLPSSRYVNPSPETLLNSDPARERSWDGSEWRTSTSQGPRWPDEGYALNKSFENR